VVNRQPDAIKGVKRVVILALGPGGFCPEKGEKANRDSGDNGKKYDHIRPLTAFFSLRTPQATKAS
jgi:hypothetical protein